MCKCTPSIRTPWCDRCRPDQTTAVQEPNGALREIAGRIKKLSYRDALALANALGDRLPERGASNAEIAAALLDAADKLEKA